MLRAAKGAELRRVRELGAKEAQARRNLIHLTELPVELRVERVGGFHPRVIDLVVRLPGRGVCYAIHESNVSADFDAPQRRTYFERFRAKNALNVEIANHLLIHRRLG